MNKQKEYNYTKTTINMRESYFNYIKTLDCSITEFLDKAIGRELDVIGKSDQWIRQEIDTKKTEISSLESLLKENTLKRNKDKKIKNRLEKEYKAFCSFLLHPVDYNTKRTNEDFGINLTDYGHFQQLQKKLEENKFTFEDFKELKQ